MKNVKNSIVKIFYSLIAIAIVIAAHYYWQMVRSHYPHSLFLVYCVSFTLLIIGGYLIFKRLTQYSYKQYKKLSNTSLFLVCTIWGVFFAFSSLYNPYNWAWSFTSEVTDIFLVRLFSYILIVSGLIGLFASILWLGIPHSTGQETNHLKVNGLYRFSRNPQIVAGAFLVLGYTILRPTWYALGWLILFVVLAHLMVLSEEEHLRNIFGEEYENYCTRIPRYLGIY